MPSNVLLTNVASLDDVAQCTENQIVFCAETGEIYTHSTRYGTPVMLNIGEDETAADIQMQPVPEANQVSRVSMMRSANVAQPTVAASEVSYVEFASPIPGDAEDIAEEPSPSVNTIIVNIAPGYVLASDGKAYAPSEFAKLNLIAVGVYAAPNLVVDLADLGIAEWGLMNVEVKSTKTNDSTIAIQDMNGAYNTSLLSGLGSSIFDQCKDDWHIPSLGELSVLADSYAAVTETMNLIGAIPMINSYYWSSTAGESNKSSWALNMANGKGQLGYRTSKLAVRKVKNV